MLSNAKHLLADYTLSTRLSLVGFEVILRYTQNDSVYSVIVSALCHAEQREASPR